jgi:hypothetical protein
MLKSEDISNFEWLSLTHPNNERLKNSYDILLFVNEKINNVYLIINNHSIYLPDSAVFYIKNNCKNSPLKKLWEDMDFKGGNSFDLGDVSDYDFISIIICIIILTYGDLMSFSYIDPFYIKGVYLFINKYIPELEKYISSVINRVINSILNNGDFLKLDAIKSLISIYDIVDCKKYYNIKKAIGYAIWCKPYTCKKFITELEISADMSFKNINWTDVYSTLLVIKYAPDEDLKKLEELRSC